MIQRISKNKIAYNNLKKDLDRILSVEQAMSVLYLLPIRMILIGVSVSGFVPGNPEPNGTGNPDIPNTDHEINLRFHKHLPQKHTRNKSIIPPLITYVVNTHLIELVNVQ